MLARTDSRSRAVVMLVVTTLVVGLIGYRLVWWQVVDRERLAEMGAGPGLARAGDPGGSRPDPRPSGLILATSTATESVFATPPTIDDPARASLLLGGILGIEPAELEATLSSGEAWTWLARRVDDERRPGSGPSPCRASASCRSRGGSTPWAGPSRERASRHRSSGS